MAYRHKDFKVKEYLTTTKELRWRVYSGKDDAVTTTRSLEEAEHIADELNKDPWYLSRGQDRGTRYG